MLWPWKGGAKRGRPTLCVGVQMVVEQQLAREGTTRQEVGREVFTQRVWAWRRQ